MQIPRFATQENSGRDDLHFLESEAADRKSRARQMGGAAASIARGVRCNRFGRLMSGGSGMRPDGIVAPETEKAFAARIAAVSGKSQNALQATKSAVDDEAPSNLFEIHASTARAVRARHEGGRNHGPCKEAGIALAATPRTQPKKTESVIHRMAPVRTLAIQAMAFRTKHFVASHDAKREKANPNLRRRQVYRCRRVP